MCHKGINLRTLFLFLLISFTALAQEADITSALRQIDSGEILSASNILKELRSKNPNDPSVIFLDAVLTTNGEEALKKYSIIYEKYPKSKYSDAALYRIFSYYYSLGYYNKAETYLAKLKDEYPNSPYIKSADRKIPDVEDVVQINSVNNTETISYKFTIQAGAFLNPDNAKKLQQQIQADGYYADITTKEVGGSILNVVNVGKFQKEEETKPVLDYLSKKHNINGRVIGISN